MGTETPDALPPTLLGLSTYLLSLTGKAARGRVADRLASRGLRLWHMAVLAALADFGPHTQRGLCARLSVDPSDMAKVVEQLAALDYLTRARDVTDRRRVSVGLTDAGRRALEELVHEARTIQDDVLAPLTTDERAQLHGLLLKVFTATRRPDARADRH
ncbi:MarR family winged helix-turn-helix transcriptional regulator [Nonomuraea sp. NPDC003727]